MILKNSLQMMVSMKNKSENIIVVSVVIVNHNGKDQTEECIRSFFAHTPGNTFEIIVMDNDSKDGSVELLKAKFPQIRVLAQKKNHGFGKANNIGVSESSGKFLFFVNNDTIFKEDIVTPLRQFLKENPSCGAVSPLLLNSDGTYQHSYGKFPSLLNELRTKRDTARFKNIPKDRSPRQVDWVSFAAVMMRRSAFDKVNGFDERYFMYFEDVDLCYRLKKAGYKSFYCAEYSIIHTGRGSRSNEIISKILIEYRRSQIIFYQSHRSQCETLALRIYLIFRFLLFTISNQVDERRRAYSIIKMALSFNAHRS